MPHAAAQGSRDRFRTLIPQPRASLGSLAGSVGLALFSAVFPSHGRSRNRSCRLRQDLSRFRSPATIAPARPFSLVLGSQIRSRDRRKLSATEGGRIAGRAGVVELAYTPALGAGARESMRVRVPPPALCSDRFCAGGCDSEICCEQSRPPCGDHSKAITPRIFLPARRSFIASLMSSSLYFCVTSSSSFSVPASYIDKSIGIASRGFISP